VVEEYILHTKIRMGNYPVVDMLQSTYDILVPETRSDCVAV
jgi:hypothetical protein